MFSVRRLFALVSVAGLALASPSFAVDPKVLPSDTELLLSINIKQILDSDVVKNNKDLVEKARKEIQKKLEEGPAKKYLDMAGINPMKDLNSLTIASSGTKEFEDGFVVLEGTFNSEKVYAAAEEAAKEAGEGLKISKMGNLKVMEIVVKDQKTIYASVVNDTHLVAAASKEALGTTVARMAAGKLPNLKPAFKAALDTVGANPGVSFVITSDAAARMAQNAPVGGAQLNELQKFDGMSFAMTFTKSIEVQIAVNAKDADTAQQTALQVNMGLGMAKAFAQNKAQQDDKFGPLAAIANTLQANNKGNNLTVRAEITQENIDKLIKLIPMP